MTRPHEDERLTMLLRTIQIPEPSPDFLAGARRRYLEGLEARYRREVFTALVAAAFAFGLAAILLRSAFTPPTLIAWVAQMTSSVAKWMEAIRIVLSLVPPVALASWVLVSVVSLLSVLSLLRVRSLRWL
jgi:hypothetical protein